MIVMLNALYIAYLDPGTTRALVPGTMNAETLAANADTVIMLGQLLSKLENKIIGGLAMRREDRGAGKRAYYVE